MANNGVAGVPTTIVFTLIISFFAFFASVTCVTLYYYKRDPRRLERLRQIELAAQGLEADPLGDWEGVPIVWEVWADRHPKPTSEWEDFLPLNLTYGCDQPKSPPLSAAQGKDTRLGSLGKTADGSTRSPESSAESQSAADCNVAVFIAMPSPYKHLPPEARSEFAIGTAEVSFHHTGPFHL